MPVPWSALFSAIPWTDVIAKAPEVAQGARKLWQKVGKRKAADAPPMPAVDPGASPEARLAALEARLAESDLRQQESAELLAALAAQNADLVHAVDELQRRARLLGALLGLQWGRWFDTGSALSRWTGVEWFNTLGESVTIVTGLIFVICVLAFRRGIMGEIIARLVRRKAGNKG